MKRIDTFPLGPIQANCYLLWNDSHVLIVDPGSNGKRVQEMIDSENAIVDGVFLTHGHFDHMAGTDTFVKKYHCPLFMNELDSDMLTNPYLNYSADFQPVEIKTKPVFVKPGRQKLGSFEVECLDAPGHSEGSTLLVWENNMFSGDVLFKQGIGRCDLPSGSNTKMKQSLSFIKTMNPDLHVYPGHGPSTTLQQELLENPYLIYNW